MGGRVFGIVMNQFKSEPNRYLTDKVATDHFYDRLQNLITRSVGFVALRGGMGTVTEVSRVPTEPTNLDPGLGIQEPVFRIRVRIDELPPRVPVDRRTLRPGMTLGANLVLETRSLWQVLLGPIIGAVRQ